MSTRVDAIYENGVFRPLKPVQIPEHGFVRLTIEADPAAADQVHFVLPQERWDAFCEALDAPPRAIPELSDLLNKPGLFDDNGTTAH